jgi:hypothetical protein
MFYSVLTNIEPHIALLTEGDVLCASVYTHLPRDGGGHQSNCSTSGIATS